MDHKYKTLLRNMDHVKFIMTEMGMKKIFKLRNLNYTNYFIMGSLETIKFAMGMRIYNQIVWFSSFTFHFDGRKSAKWHLQQSLRMVWTDTRSGQFIVLLWKLQSDIIETELFLEERLHWRYGLHWCLSLLNPFPFLFLPINSQLLRIQRTASKYTNIGSVFYFDLALRAILAVR